MIKLSIRTSSLILHERKRTERLEGENIRPMQITKELSKSSLDFEKLAYCYECGTCTAACPVTAVFPKYYNPRTFFQKIFICPEDILKDIELWFCAVCDLCRKRCPHGLKLPEVFLSLRTLAIDRGPDAVNKIEGTLKILREEIPFPVSYC